MDDPDRVGREAFIKVYLDALARALDSESVFGKAAAAFQKEYKAAGGPGEVPPPGIASRLKRKVLEAARGHAEHELVAFGRPSCSVCGLIWLDRLQVQTGMWEGFLSESRDEPKHKKLGDEDNEQHYVFKSDAGVFAVDSRITDLPPDLSASTRPYVFLRSSDAERIRVARYTNPPARREGN